MPPLPRTLSIDAQGRLDRLAELDGYRQIALFVIPYLSPFCNDEFWGRVPPTASVKTDVKPEQDLQGHRGGEPISVYLGFDEVGSWIQHDLRNEKSSR